MLLIVFIIFILYSPGLIANASIIFNTVMINQYIVRALFWQNIATALLQTKLSVNEEYTSSKTFNLTHLFVNLHIFFKSLQLYTCSVFNYILISFYVFSRLTACQIGWRCVQENNLNSWANFNYFNSVLIFRASFDLVIVFWQKYNWVLVII